MKGKRKARVPEWCVEWKKIFKYGSDISNAERKKLKLWIKGDDKNILAHESWVRNRDQSRAQVEGSGLDKNWRGRHFSFWVLRKEWEQVEARWGQEAEEVMFNNIL